jgi:hypothetical protein
VTGPDPDRFHVPLTEREQAGLAGWAGVAGSPEEAQRRGVIGSMIEEDLPFEVGPEEYMNYYGTAIEAPAREAYMDAEQALAHRYGSGGTAGRTLEELGKSRHRFELGLAAQKAGIGLQGAERRQELMMTQRAMMPNLLRAGRAEQVFGPTMQVEAGGYARNVEQQKKNLELFKWLMEQPQNNPWLGFMQSAMGQNPGTVFSGGMGGGNWLQSIPIAGDFLQGVSSLF